MKSGVSFALFLVLLAARAAVAQYIEGYVRLDDTYSGNDEAACVAYDSAANAIYSTGWHATVVFDAATGVKLARMPQYGSWVVAAPADSKMYVLGSSLYSFDASNHRLLGTVEVRSRTWEVTPPAAVSPTQHKLYLCADHSVIGVVDTRADTLLRTISMPGAVSGLCYAPDLEKLYVTGRREITVIDCASDSIVAVLPFWTNRYWVQAYSPVSHKLYHGGDYLTVIDCRADTVLKRERLPYFVAFMAYDPTTNRVYCDYGERAVLVIDCATDSVVRVTETRGQGTWFVSLLSPAAAKFYYDADDDNRATIWVYDCVADSQVAVLRGGFQGFGPPYPNLCHNPRDNVVYLTNYERGTVTVIDGAGDSLLKTIVVGSDFGLDELWCDRTTGRVYGLAENFGVLSLIDGETNTLLGTRWVGPVPYVTAFNAVARKAYIVDEEEHDLVVVSMLADTVTAWIDRVFYPPLVASADGRRLLAGRGSTGRGVWLIDCTSDTLLGSLALVQEPDLLAASSRLNKVCAVCGSAVVLIDLDSMPLSRTIPLIHDVRALGYSPTQECWYCFGPSGADTVTVIDGRGDSVRARLSVPGVRRYEPLGQALWSPHTDRLYYPTSEESCAVFDCQSNRVVATVPLRSARLCDTIRNRIYGIDRNGVAVLDGATDSVLVRFPLAEPGQMAWNPANGRVYVGSGGSLVVVIRDTTTGIDEGAARLVLGPSAMATVVRGVLRLGDLGHDPKSPGGFRSCPASLLDAAGREVMELQAGPNDVRHLVPGVYFVRKEPQATGSKSQAVRRVVIGR